MYSYTPNSDKIKSVINAPDPVDSENVKMSKSPNLQILTKISPVSGLK